MELLRKLPTEAEYTPLAEHQAQTPTSFYNAPAILYCVARGATLTVHPAQLRALPALVTLAGLDVANGHADSENNSDPPASVDVSGIEMWVVSDKLILTRPTISIGVAISYQSIALHAVASTGLYLQLSTAEFGAQDEYETESTVEVTLVPSADNNEGSPDVKALYEALSECSDRNPDPADQDSDEADGHGVWSTGNAGASDGDSEPLYQIISSAGDMQSGLPPPMPGSGGWITADNVGDFFDADGNWKGPGEAPSLGPGAGTVRSREDGVGNGGADSEEGDETKWQRTD